MASPFLAEIRVVSFNFAPKGWALCNGQTLSINQNQALFALLGTTYGGNGITTFALPNLQSRAPIHFGQGRGCRTILGTSRGRRFPHGNHERDACAHPHIIRPGRRRKCDLRRGRRTCAAADRSGQCLQQRRGRHDAGRDGYDYGRQPAAPKLVAVSDAQLYYRPRRDFSVPELTPEETRHWQNLMLERSACSQGTLRRRTGRSATDRPPAYQPIRCAVQFDRYDLWRGRAEHLCPARPA